MSERVSERRGADAATEGTADRVSERILDADNYPDTPAENMTSRQLAEFQEQFTRWARNRIVTDGVRQYDRGSRQAFEDMNFPDLVVAAQEELADIVNYATMLAIQLDRLKQAV